MQERVLSRLTGLLDRVTHLDAAQPPGRRLNVLFDQISAALYRRMGQDRLEKLADAVGKAVSEKQKTDLVRQMRETLGIELSSLGDRKLAARIKAFTAENVALIKRLPQQYFDRVEGTIMRGMNSGLRHTEIAKAVAHDFGISERKAALIARDQVLSFYGDLNAVRQQDLGIGRYVWRTANDDRVRDEHAERDGEVYSWAAEGEQPGEAINCRCFAEPYLEDL